nr:uncharacterized protein LOC109181117 [Ipomoea trifida]
MMLRDDGRRARRWSFLPSATNERSRATASFVPAIFFRSASGSSGRSAWLLFSGGDELLGSREHRRPRNSNPTGTGSLSVFVGGSREAAKVDPVPYLSAHLNAFFNGQREVCSEPLVTPKALLDIGCVRGVPLPPPPQPLVPRLLVLSSEESGGSEGDVVEGEESSSGASNPDYRGSFFSHDFILLALFDTCFACLQEPEQQEGLPRGAQPVTRTAPQSSPPGQAPVPRSRHSSASTTADNPAPGFATSAPGFAAPMGSTFAMPSASPSWPVSIPPSVSLLQGDVPAEDVMRSLISARDRESCRGRPDYRAMIEAMVRYGAMGDALEVEAKARQELEAQMGSLNLQCEQLSFQREQMALREKRALEGQRAAEERSAMAVSRYRESSAFPVDVRAYISEHVEESYEALKATRAGSRYVAMEAAHMADIDPSFDPEAWGLPLELMDPEPQIEIAASHGASGTGAALGDDPFLALGTRRRGRHPAGPDSSFPGHGRLSLVVSVVVVAWTTRSCALTLWLEFGCSQPQPCLLVSTLLVLPCFQ